MIRNLHATECSNIGGGTVGTFAGNLALIIALASFKTDFTVLGNNAMLAVNSGGKVESYLLNTATHAGPGCSARSAAFGAVFGWVAKSISVSWLTQHVVEGIASLFKPSKPATAE